MTSFLDEVKAAPDPAPPLELDWGQEILDSPEPEKPKRRRGRPRKNPLPDDDSSDKSTEDKPKRVYTPRAGKLKEDLLEPYVELAADIAIVAPTVSGVLIVRAEKTVDGLVDLAAGHPRVLNALKKASNVGKGAALIETLLLVLVAAAVDLGRLDPRSPLLDRFGHSEVVKDEKGQPVKEGQRILKSRTTLREIYNATHSEEEQVDSFGPPPPPDMGVDRPWDVTTGTAPTRSVPMNNLWATSG